MLDTSAAAPKAETGNSAQAAYSSRSRYPVELIDVVLLKAGQRVTIRPVLPQDDAVTGAFFRRLSPVSRNNRFMGGFAHVPQALLTQFTTVDYKMHVALIAEIFVGGREIAIGEARYVVTGDGNSAEFAVSIADEWQGSGLGSLLLRKLIATARQSGVNKITGETLASNTAMRRVAEKLGFSSEPDGELRGLVHLTLDISGPGARARRQL